MKRTRVCLSLVCAALSLVLMYRIREAEREGVSPGQPQRAAPKLPAIVRALRPNYPYSVIPGGVYSPDELRRNVEKDPLVRNHYSGFDVRAARLVAASSDRLQYASYRMNGQIYWTKRRLRIPKGEILMTDGRNLARTRCGNRLSEVPVPETAQLEPEPPELSLPPFSMDLLKNGLLTLAVPPAEAGKLPVQPFSAAPPILAVDQWPATPTVWPIAMPMPGGSITPQPSPPTFGNPPTPGIPSVPGTEPPPLVPGGPPVVSEIPEPGALTLFGIFLIASGWALARMRRLSPVATRAVTTNGTRLQRLP